MLPLSQSFTDSLDDIFLSPSAFSGPGPLRGIKQQMPAIEDFAGPISTIFSY
jgi:hypothetical protein